MDASPTEPPSAIYHLKIVLMDVAPTVWRRFQVPASMALADLHRTIQIIMGWKGWHLHSFHIAGDAYGPPQPCAVKDERRAILGALVPPLHPKSPRARRPFRNVRSLFRYEYNLHDAWQLEIRVEKVGRANPEHRYPRCVAGAWAAPPEDCGGPSGYADLGGREDGVFDVDQVNDGLRHAFGLDAEQEPLDEPPPPKRAPRAADSESQDRTLPEPFETLVRAREGRASSEEALPAYVRIRRMLDVCLSILQRSLHRKSLKQQERVAKEIARTRKVRDDIAAKIASLEEEL